jgi:hypothetical protein
MKERITETVHNVQGYIERVQDMAERVEGKIRERGYSPTELKTKVKETFTQSGTGGSNLSTGVKGLATAIAGTVLANKVS